MVTEVEKKGKEALLLLLLPRWDPHTQPPLTQGQPASLTAHLTPIHFPDTATWAVDGRPGTGRTDARTGQKEAVALIVEEEGRVCTAQPQPGPLTRSGPPERS